MYHKHVTARAQRNLVKRLNLPEGDAYNQDWEYVIAESCMLEELLEAYINLDFDVEERFALMEIIVACYDHSFYDGTVSQDKWDIIK